MIDILVVLLIVFLSSVMSHVDKVDESNFLVNRITDCFFINDDVERVELVCDNNGGNYPKDSCYSSLFVSESRDVNRSKVKYLQSGQCRSETFDDSQLAEINNKFPNVTDLNLSLLGTQDLLYERVFFRHLKVLNISHNKIGLGSNATQFYLKINGNLDVLDASFNDLSIFFGLKTYFYGNMTTMNLSYNSITHLPVLLLFYVKALRVLDLRSNKIEYLDANAFKSVHGTLEEIHLQNNKIKQFVPNMFNPTYRLDYLNLSENQIEDYNWYYLKYFVYTIQHLDLSYNHIEQIVLDYQPTHLLSLDVSYNRIRTFNYTHAEITKLNVLNLEGNDLDQLDTIIPSLFPNLTTIAISKNRFDCEYAKRFAEQWENITVVGDLCDQNGNEGESADYSTLYAVIGLFGTTIAIAAISLQFVRYKKLSAKKPEIVENEKIQCRSTDQYEEPLPFVEPIYHEIDYAATSAPNLSHTNKQYDHLTRDPMPLSPIQLHYDNLKK